MTKGLNKIFDLPSMDEILEETDDIVADEELSLPVSVESPDDLCSTALEQIEQHSRAMETIYTDTLKHAIDAAELAFDLDPARAPRMLEVSGNLYGKAMEAQNSKVDTTMKMLKLINDRKKLNIEEQKMKHEMGNLETNKADVVMVEDRNTLLKRLKEEAAKEKK